MTPALHHRTPSGWADDRLMEAYDLIHAVMTDNANAVESRPELRGVLSAIESADDALATNGGPHA